MSLSIFKLYHICDMRTSFLLRLKEIHNLDIHYILTGVKNNESNLTKNEV